VVTGDLGGRCAGEERRRGGTTGKLAGGPGAADREEGGGARALGKMGRGLAHAGEREEGRMLGFGWPMRE
jgi:hypothetical protein